MAEALDAVARYSESLGFVVRARTIIVEGNTDVALFELASRLEFNTTGVRLLDESLAVVSAGTGDAGGTNGVIRTLIALREMARVCLLPDGRPKYRFVGLFDNDGAGRQAVGHVQTLDTSILEYKDVFRLRPVMPRNGNLDHKALRASFEKENSVYAACDWELEDFLTTDLIDAFLSEFPTAVTRTVRIGGERSHRDFSRDGKARLHRFVRENALREDVAGVAEVLRALRYYCRLKA